METCMPPVMSTAPRPIQLLVYHLPPPPPGCFYAFSTSYDYGQCPRPLHVVPLAVPETFIPLCPLPMPFHPCFPQRNTVACSKLSTNLERFENCKTRVNLKPIPLLEVACNTRDSISSLPGDCKENNNDLLGSGAPSNSSDPNLEPTNLSDPPSSTEVVHASSSSNAENQASNPGVGEAQHRFGTSFLSEDKRRPDAADPTALRFWSTKGTGFIRPQFPDEIGQLVVKWGHNASSSGQSGMTPDEAIAHNKRFNKTPSFRNKKIVRTSSRNSCLSETGKKVDLANPEKSGSSGDPAGWYRSHTSKQGQRRITEYWRVREKPKEIDCGCDGRPDSREKSGSSKSVVGSNPNVGEMIDLMHRSFSFGLASCTDSNRLEKIKGTASI